MWSDLPVPIILDLDVDVLAVAADDDGTDADDTAAAAAVVQVHYSWRFRPCLFRLYSWGRCILPPAVQVILAYLAWGLRRRVSARGGSGIRDGEIDFLMEGMDRFRSWVAMHRRLRSCDVRLPAECYEEDARWRWVREEERRGFRRLLRWWDDVEAEVRGLKMSEGRVC